MQLSLQAQKKPAFFLGAPHAAMLLGVIFLSVSLLFLFFPEFQVPSKFLFFLELLRETTQIPTTLLDSLYQFS